MLILCVYTHFSRSATRREDLKNLYSISQDVESYIEFKKHVSTRWLSLKPAIDRILEHWDILKIYFMAAHNKNASNVDKLIMDMLVNENENHSTELYLRYLSYVFAHFEEAIKQLQKESSCVVELYKILDKLIKKLNALSLSKFYGRKVSTLLKTFAENQREPILLRIKNTTIHAKNYLILSSCLD